ncbi:MAG: helix-turn-helix domain-containing protein [Candidatus Limnocylindrales bacterium]
MPRISPAREHAVRSRILESALRVFAEKGYHGATIADVVRRSGLSVGAIYTWYAGKDELFLAVCDMTAGEGLGELGARIIRGRSTAERLAIGMGFWLDAMAGLPGEPDMASTLVMQWSRADAEPTIRASLRRRRDRSTAAAEMLVREGIATGELPSWVDASALAGAAITFLDGMLLWRLEQGDEYRREDAERHAFAFVRMLLAAAATTMAPSIPVVAPQPWGMIARDTDHRLPSTA